MSTTWSLNAGQLITRSYRMLGNLTPPWTPNDDQMTQGILMLNAVLKGQQADGINLYRQEQITFTLPAMTPFVSITPLVLGVEQVNWIVTPSPNAYKRPLGYYSYTDYFNLPNPDSNTTSGPSVYMFDKQTNASNIWFWPLSTNGGTAEATVGRTVNDVNDPSDPLDFPTEWTRGMIYVLADALMEDSAMGASDPQTAQRITQRAELFYSKLLDFDRPTSVFIRPWGSKGSDRLWR